MVAQDLAKPTSAQPIKSTCGLAKPTPMHLIQRPHLSNITTDVQPQNHMHLRGGTYKHTYTERLCISNDVIQDVTSDHMAAQDLAKPTSLQPIVATYGLAKPTPMHLIQNHFSHNIIAYAN